MHKNEARIPSSILQEDEEQVQEHVWNHAANLEIMLLFHGLTELESTIQSVHRKIVWEDVRSEHLFVH